MRRPDRVSDPVASSPPSARTLPPEISRRVVIDEVTPSIDSGRFAIKRTPGERVDVTAVILVDGHDLLQGVVKYRRVHPAPEDEWRETPLEFAGNDRWRGSFTVDALGACEYTVEAWIDRFGSWVKGLVARFGAGQDVASELLEGAELVQSSLRTGADRQTAVAAAAASSDAEGDLTLLEFADLLRRPGAASDAVAAAQRDDIRQLMTARADRSNADLFSPALTVTVDPTAARFSAWYEMFPRSCTDDPSRSGTFAEAERRLPDIAAMGFDVVYLPPIHPIGVTHRKGPNNSLHSGPGDPGSPWAIGAAAGGHTAIEPGLGTLDDFDRFVRVANRLGMEVALDIAFQASPDHPWVQEHPEWFRHRPDGSIKYAENPPKKYQDIYPFDFESPHWEALWSALRDVFLFWIGHGVRIFRVDNPHTKSFRFWGWCIDDVRARHPDAIFLAEAFTRPAAMRYLAKTGFNQSYTYFTWRNSAEELRDYLVELTSTDLQQFMRPNFFANTPDILHEYLQHGGRPAFEARLLLAALLSSSYGIYSGYELCEHEAVRPGSEEYLDSEKYQIRVRDWDQPGHIKELIARVNAIRRANPALQRNDTLAFHGVDNPSLLWFSKRDDEGNRVFVLVNTDPFWMQHGWVQMPLHEMGLADGLPYEMEDQLDGRRYAWRGEWNYVRLDPGERMGHVFVIASHS